MDYFILPNGKLIVTSQYIYSALGKFFPLTDNNYTISIFSSTFSSPTIYGDVLLKLCTLPSCKFAFYAVQNSIESSGANGYAVVISNKSNRLLYGTNGANGYIYYYNNTYHSFTNDGNDTSQEILTGITNHDLYGLSNYNAHNVQFNIYGFYIA